MCVGIHAVRECTYMYVDCYMYMYNLWAFYVSMLVNTLYVSLDSRCMGHAKDL